MSVTCVFLNDDINYSEIMKLYVMLTVSY